MALKSQAKYQDTVRDKETLEAKNVAWKQMEQVEYDFYKRGVASREEVEEARDEYIETWEARRDFILGEKYGLTT